MSEGRSEMRQLLIVEDDETFARTLSRSFERRGYKVDVAHSIEQFEAIISSIAPQYAVVDLRLGAGSGLNVVRALHALNPAIKIVVLTGYASIATAVEAIKLGASHYLPKPANSDDIEAAFDKADGDADVPITDKRTSIKNWEWERIHQTLTETDFNISEAARRLGMHRRTLARKLEKRPIK